MTSDLDTSWVEPPLRLEAQGDVAWNEAADIVIVGLGAAGVSAALQSAELGLDALAIDRFGGGGASAISGGVYYGGKTSIQREAGVTDSLEEMLKYLNFELAGAVRPETLRSFVDQNADNLDWLMQHGAVFNPALYTAKTAYPPDGYYLYYSGNERLSAYEQRAKPAPRGHRAFNPAGGPSGGALMAPLLAAVERSAVRQLRHAPVVRLVTDRHGAVLGVEAAVLPAEHHPEHERLYAKVRPVRTRLAGDETRRAIEACRDLERRHGVRRLIRARAGVVLCAGGFTHNPAWLKRYGTADYSKGVLMGRISCDGSGIALGMSVGGATHLMESMFSACKLAPPNAFAHGALVGPDGRRFQNEEAYAGTLGRDIAKKFGGRAWIVLDRALLLQAIGQCMPDGSGRFTTYYAPVLLNMLFGGTKLAFSVEGLATQCGMDPQVLAQTIESVNRIADGVEDDPFGKSESLRDALRRPPYVAINLSVHNPWSFTSCFSLGGLCVDEASGQVLGADGRAIEGLYAAGRTAVGLPSESYVSGMSISDCVFSGRRAARALAARCVVVAQ